MHSSQDASGIVAHRERKDADAAAQARIQATEDAAAEEKKAAEAEKAVLEKAAAQAHAEANREAQLKHAKLHEKEQEALIQVNIHHHVQTTLLAGLRFSHRWRCVAGNHAAA